MAIIHLLGTGAALSDPHRTTTMIAFDHPDSLLVVDCGGDLLQRMLAAGLDPDRIAGLILTHEHPDHVGGFPLLIERIWLAGRSRPLPVYGPEAAIDQAERIFQAFNTEGWSGLPALERHPIPLDEGAHVLRDAGWEVTASPGDHGVPVVALRFVERTTGRVAVYSSDTRPSAAVMRLAASADLLIHEATGAHPVHSSMSEAATVAREAGAGRLVLVHLPPEKYRPDAEFLAARSIFPALELGEELGTIAL